MRAFPTPCSIGDLGLDWRDIEDRPDNFLSLPVHTYFDPAVFDFELDAVFAGRWQFFAPLAKLSATGDAVTGEVGRVPVVVVRGDDGTLRGFVNACRHRGYPVVKEDGWRRRLVCGYHGWTYRLDGALVHARDAESDPTFCREALSLLPVAVDQWAQCVFVNTDPDAAPLRRAHPRLEALAAEGGFDPDPERYRLHREAVIDIAANWKLWYDNGVECYHCPTLHGESFAAAFDVSPERNVTVLTDHLMNSHFAPAAARDDGGDTLRSNRYCSFQLFPGCQLIQQDDLAVLARIVPTGAQSCRFIAHYLAERDADPERVEAWIELWHRTYDEDTDAVERQQRGLCSGRVPRLRYVPAREKPALFINGLIREAYREALSEAPPAARAALG